MNDFLKKYRSSFQTQTHDKSKYAYGYVSGLLRIETKRNMATIARKTGMDEQNTRHFMSNSPWSSSGLIADIQSEIKQHPEFQTGAMLVVDESAEQKAGEYSAGAGRQYNGRLGKIEMSQVGVFAALVTPRVNSWIDGELFFPESWFEEGSTDKRKKVGFPEGRKFKTKPELVWEIIQRLQAKGMPFDAVAMDDLYGRNGQLRKRLDGAGIEYYGDIPKNSLVYLDKPQIIYPMTKQGKPTHKYQVIAKQRYTASELLKHPDLEWAEISLRPNERGQLCAQFGRCRVWLVDQEGECHQEWLLIRKDNKQITYALSNASPTTSLKTMAWRKSHRYFVERSNQDAKGELGWDEFQAIKYLAWEHQLALTILASWFIAETRLDWMKRFERDPALLELYQIDVLPLLSVSNVRELLRAAIPLPQLSVQDAARLVVKHLANRTRSRKSRLRKRRESSFLT
ncbi:MAG: IS701 family transposase [Nitrospirota bacterium]|nr:IS701 family transposase [Nitrospirota bacterium]